LLSYRGRTTSVINCGGNKVYPEEVEEVLRSHPSVQQARVLGESHPLLGSIIVAQIVLNPESASDEQGWRSLCSEHLSGFKVPKEFRIVVELPMTGSGKVVRHNTEAQEPKAWTAVNG
jgi:acyl-CoA synthetase (AMP-forming)/AMP-acid ligase II